MRLLAVTGRRGISLTELAKLCGLPHPTVHRILKRLVVRWAHDCTAHIDPSLAIAEQFPPRIDPAAFKAYFHAWFGASFADELKGCSVPVKVVVGANDPDVTLDFMKATFGTVFVNVEFVQLTGCGHNPTIETPLQLATEIERFFAS